MNALISNYTELTVNILQAKVSSVESWLEIQLVGNAPLIENAISWLRDQGIAVETLSA